MDEKLSENQFGFIAQEMREAFIKHNDREPNEYEEEFIHSVGMFLSSSHKITNKAKYFSTDLNRLSSVGALIVGKRIKDRKDEIRQTLENFESDE